MAESFTMRPLHAYPMELAANGMTVERVVFLDDELWRAFKAFYELCFRYPELLGAYNRSLPERLRFASFSYFNQIQAASDPEAAIRMADCYFENFKPVWDASQQRNAALWESVYRIVKQWEEGSGFRLHKGSLLYCWATSHVLSGDVPLGFILLNRAVDEDRWHIVHPIPDRYAGFDQSTPALDFISFRSRSADHLYPFLRTMKEFVEERLRVYREVAGHDLRSADVASLFFATTDRELEDLKLFFAYTIVRLMELEKVHGMFDVADERMAPMILYDTLSDMIVIVEEILRIALLLTQERSTQLTFINYLQELAVTYAWTADTKHYHATVNNAHLTRKNFQEVIAALLGGSYRTKEGRALQELERDLVLAYQLRNFSAHTVRSQKVLWDRFPEILQAIMNCFFLGIEQLAERKTVAPVPTSPASVPAEGDVSQLPRG